MKKSKLSIIVLSLAFVLGSCSFKGASSSQSSGGLHTSETSGQVTSQNFDANSSEKTGGATTYHVYAVNDFHGSILERVNGGNYEGGLEKVGGYLKARKDEDPDHTLIISSGDMWQGSLESNDNHGFLITEAMNYIGFDSMTLGNHDFDYGQDWLFQNQEKADFPFLAGNIMKWDTTNKVATTERWEHSQNSTIVERGGHKIGIVGMIGSGQTTSITSPNVSDIIFENPKTYAENEATSLRNQGCDIVLLSLHNTVTDVSGWGNIKSYFDAVFGGHTHREETMKSSDGVPMLQGACNGEYVSHFEITIDASSNVDVTTWSNIAASSSWSKDAGITNIMNKYLDTDEFKTKANRSCGTLTGNFSKSSIANAGCKAIYEKYKGEYSELACTMENSQRASISSGDFTYSDLYKATPFMNNIIICKVKGADIIAEARYNLTYTGNTTKYGSLENETYYTIGVIDYLVYHQNVNKQYDYFPSFTEDNVIAIKEAYPMDITYDYFQQIGPSINASDFSSSAPGFGLYA